MNRDQRRLLAESLDDRVNEARDPYVAAMDLNSVTSWKRFVERFNNAVYIKPLSRVDREYIGVHVIGASSFAMKGIKEAVAPPVQSFGPFHSVRKFAVPVYLVATAMNAARLLKAAKDYNDGKWSFDDIKEANVAQKTPTKSGDEYDATGKYSQGWRGKTLAKKSMNKRQRQLDKKDIEQRMNEEDKEDVEESIRVQPPRSIQESRPWQALDEKKEDPFDVMRRECNEIIAKESSYKALPKKGQVFKFKDSDGVIKKAKMDRISQAGGSDTFRAFVQHPEGMDYAQYIYPDQVVEADEPRHHSDPDAMVTEPGFVKTAKDEEDWDRAKKLARDGKADNQYALANHIFQNIKGAR